MNKTEKYKEYEWLQTSQDAFELGYRSALFQADQVRQAIHDDIFSLTNPHQEGSEAYIIYESAIVTALDTIQNPPAQGATPIGSAE